MYNNSIFFIDNYKKYKMGNCFSFLKKNRSKSKSKYKYKYNHNINVISPLYFDISNVIQNSNPDNINNINNINNLHYNNKSNNIIEPITYYNLKFEY